jgi:isopentenyl phosphate kinase
MELVFLKLGGSVITDKNRPYTPRQDKLDALLHEIASVIKEQPEIQLVLGHGSGSYGHSAASIYDTRNGVSGSLAWRGFSEVWYQASSLNRLVVDSLHRYGLPAVTFSPLASVIAHDGIVSTWNTLPIQTALERGLLPVIHGDVVFDEIRGGTILSTEDLFAYLAGELSPKRILLAGLETGVWADFPARKHLLMEITPKNLAQQVGNISAAEGMDVTGGMFSKVTKMLDLLKEFPSLEILIFSGEEPGNIRRVLLGENPGTRLHR